MYVLCSDISFTVELVQFTTSKTVVSTENLKIFRIKYKLEGTAKETLTLAALRTHIHVKCFVYFVTSTPLTMCVHTLLF